MHTAVFSRAGGAIREKQSNYEQLTMSMTADPWSRIEFVKIALQAREKLHFVSLPYKWGSLL